MKPGSMSSDAVVDDLDAVAGDLGPAGGEQLGWRHPVAGQEPLHVGGRGVAWRAGVDHGDPASRPSEHQGGAQAGGSAADDHHVEVLVVRSWCDTSWPPLCTRRRATDNVCCCFRESVLTAAMATSPEITSVLAEVGGRLRRVRTQRA